MKASLNRNLILYFIGFLSSLLVIINDLSNELSLYFYLSLTSTIIFIILLTLELKSVSYVNQLIEGLSKILSGNLNSRIHIPGDRILS